MTPASRPAPLRLREQQVFLLLAILVGILAGLSAVLFAVAIEQANRRFFGVAPSRLRLFAVPPLVSLLTGWMLVRLFPDVRGSGVPQTEAAYHLSGGVIKGRVPLGKFITGVLCVGSGHSMGREGPSVQIGAGVASAIGRWVHLSPGRLRDLIPVGTAGALAAAFNTPVAAVLFSLEEIIGDLNASLIGSTVVASVAAVVVERSILGNEPLFHVPAYHLVHPAELVAYAALGGVGGLVSLLFCRGLLALRRVFLRLPRATKMFQPALGGLVIGAVIMWMPAIMGVGYEYVDQALNGGLVWKTMAMLCCIKLGATIVSYASGNAGGIFGPSLYIGAMVGGTMGFAVQRLAPFPVAEPGAYALVGMGTLFAGIIRAPMTSVFMIFELTQDYQILVPLMVANMLSYAISKHYQPMSVYHALLRQDGVHLPSPTTGLPTTAWTAGDVMEDAGLLVPANTSIQQAWRMVDDRHEPVHLLGAHERVTGAVAHARLERASRSGEALAPVASIAEGGFVHVHADHPAEIVLARFAESGGVLPVVSRIEANRLEGVITARSIRRFTSRRLDSPALN